MDNRRLILLLAFSFSLVMLWDSWQKYSQPKVVPAISAAQAPALQPLASLPHPIPGLPIPATPETAVAAEQIETFTVKTDLFVAHISRQGGDIVRLELNDYKDRQKTKTFWDSVLGILRLDFNDDQYSASTTGKQNFALFEAKHQYLAQSGLIGEGLPNHKTVFSAAGGGNRDLAPDAQTVELRLEAPVSSGVRVTKIFTFTRGSYLINVAHEIDNGSEKEVAAHAYYQLQRNVTPPAGESSMVSTYTGPAVYTEQDKYQKVTFAEIEKDKAKFATKAYNGWIAMVQHYFVAAWIPATGLAREFYMRKIEGWANPAVVAGVIVPAPLASPGAKVVFSVPIYAGPQIQTILEQLAKPAADGGIGAHGLPLVVDYGWLTVVAAPIFWCLGAIHKVVGNWGWSIVLLTIGIKLMFFPLSAASYKSMSKMRTVTPRLAALKERYGDDRQKLNQEMMELYRREKINPLGGCLPIAVQIPVFIALYWALLGAVEIRDAPWILWITDLSSRDPYFVLPLIMVATMLIQTRLNPTPPDPIQAKVMMMMPFIFGAMFFAFPAGLVLYWVVNNTLSIAQQWQITRMLEGGKKTANDSKA